jgi:hypothetical protein
MSLDAQLFQASGDGGIDGTGLLVLCNQYDVPARILKTRA